MLHNSIMLLHLLSTTSHNLIYIILLQKTTNTFNMDVRDLMAFKPSQTPKRPAAGEIPKTQDDMDDDPADSYEARAKKRKLAMKKAQEVIRLMFLKTSDLK